MPIRALILVLALVCLVPIAAVAHPHVWVSVRSTVVYDAAGHPASIRHAWTFDEMFSTFSTQGLDLDGDGAFSREELKDLAEVNVTSLSEYGFFTFASAAGEEIKLNPPVDHWLEHDGKALTLHFILPVASPEGASPGPLAVEVYDPTYFVSFTFARDGPARLENAPPACTVETRGPPSDALNSSGQVPEEFFTNLDAGLAQDFTNRITVRCPGDAALASTEAPLIEAAPARGEGAMETAAGGAKDAARAPGAASASRDMGALGVIRPDGAPAVAEPNSLMGWIAVQQAAFYQKLSSALGRVKQDGSALVLLSALAFAYGVFHAAGPGHGKVVIASYLVASGETLRRGILISFASALAQAATAIAAVLLLSAILGASAQALGATAWWMEAASYAAIAALGLMLVWRKGRAFLTSMRGEPVMHDCGPDCDHHSHMPDPESLRGPFDWKRAVAAVGFRPCTGAIVVLVFALAQGILWAGVVATLAMALGTAITVSAIAAFSVLAKSAALRMAGGGSSGGLLAVRGLEVAAGAAILLMGAVLLAGMLSGGVGV